MRPSSNSRLSARRSVKIGDVARGGFLEEPLGRFLLLEQHLGVGGEVREGVGERKRIRHALLAKPLQLRAQAFPGGVGRGREIRGHVLGEGRDGTRQVLVPRLTGLLRDRRRRKRQISGRVAHDRVAGLEAFDAFLLRFDRVQVRVEAAREAIGQAGDPPGGLGQLVLQPRHAGNEGGQRVEVRERIRLHPGDLDAPVRGELLDLPDEADGRSVVLLAVVAGEHVQRSGQREQEGRDDDAENDRSGFHGFSSSDSPASVLMNATIASLSSSGASRPS